MFQAFQNAIAICLLDLLPAFGGLEALRLLIEDLDVVLLDLRERSAQCIR
jgi:hypothetical protein